eukprot:336552-Prymnesium_polylepis.1
MLCAASALAPPPCCGAGLHCRRSRPVMCSINSTPTITTHMPLAPPMTIEKYETMTARRVEATLEFTMHPTWKQWATQAAEVMNILKERHPDITLSRVIEAVSDAASPPLMQLRVEGRVCARLSPGRGAVYLPMQQ